MLKRDYDRLIKEMSKVLHDQIDPVNVRLTKLETALLPQKETDDV